MSAKGSCPYNCSRGKIFDINTKEYVKCPYCSKLLQEEVTKGIEEDGKIISLSEKLGIKSDFLSDELVFKKSVIPEQELAYLEADSLDYVGDYIQNELYYPLSLGYTPKCSVCIGIGGKGRVDRLVYPLMAKAYLSGLKVAPLISSVGYNRAVINMDSSIDEYLTADVVCVFVVDGSSKADILAVKGLMQSRACNGLATIIVTLWTAEAVSTLLGYADDGYFLAKPLIVKYINSGKNTSKYIHNLTGVTNDVYNSNLPSESNSSNFEDDNIVTLQGLLDD